MRALYRSLYFLLPSVTLIPKNIVISLILYYITVYTRVTATFTQPLNIRQNIKKSVTATGDSKCLIEQNICKQLLLLSPLYKRISHSLFAHLHICTFAHWQSRICTFAKHGVTGDSKLHKLRCIRARVRRSTQNRP